MDAVSRRQAIDIVTEALVERIRRKMRVWGFGDAGCPRPIYEANNARYRDSWVVRIPTEPPYLLRSSEIVSVSKATGEILYSGSANDEG
ncbi:MAG TPA: hypothetical protein PLU30_11355 [Verrucomicrobiae bacterium]|nr:hypothetical protein [Verrucomicrobiae bacterium]